MLTAHQCHHTILAHLLEPFFVELRLVARFCDPILGNADNNEVQVFVPDLHLVSDEASLRYSYSFNHRHAFVVMMNRLLRAREDLEAEEHSLQCIQLGDLYDFWREGRDDPTSIMDDHSTLLAYLYRHPDGLRAKVLTGNHDAAMAADPSFFRRLFLGGESPFGLAMHGDWFDPLETALPDWLQAFFVQIAGKIPKEGSYDIGELQTLIADHQPDAATLVNRIRIDGAAKVGSLRQVNTPNSSPPKIHNVSLRGEGDEHPLLHRAVELVHTCAQREDLHEAWPKVRLVVIGHTHRAQISVDRITKPDHPVVIMDCGAWIEKCKDSRGRVQRNAQLGVVCGDDCRIYQLVVPG
ncbi:MAG: hypothetical protein V3W41_17295 [Planctomycetota bacterium]